MSLQGHIESQELSGVVAHDVGISPTVKVTPTEQGHEVSITDVNGEKVFPVLNGDKGDKGEQGDAYVITDADKEEIATDILNDELSKYMANAIITKHSGETIVTNDSAKAPLQSMKVFGKSEQVSIAGNQLLSEYAVELEQYGTVTKSGVTATVTDDGNIKVSGTADANINITVHKNIILTAGETYTLSGLASQNFYIWDGVGSVTLVSKPSGKNSVTFTANNTGSHNFSFNTPPNGTYNGEVLLNMMLVKGSVAKDWEPYVGGIASPNMEYKQDIHSNGESGSIAYGLYGGNLIPFMTEGFTSTKNGLTLTVYKDKCVVSGTPASTYSQAISNKISLPKGTYRIKGGEMKSGCAYIQITIEKEGQRFFYFTDATFTIDGTETAVYVSIQVGNYTTALNDYVLYPTLNVGTEALSFELYKEPQSLILQTPNGLGGIPVSSGGNYTDANGQQWICDEVDLKRGKRVQRITEVVFDGSSDEKWVIDGVGRYRTNIVDVSNKKIITPTNINDVGNAMCTHANIYSAGSTYQHTGIGMSLDTNGRIQFYLGEAEQNLDTWNTRLAESPVTCYFVLQTPIETDLTEEEIAQYKALLMNYPNNTILNDTNAYTEIEQVSDTKIYIDKKFEELAVALVSQ